MKTQKQMKKYQTEKKTNAMHTHRHMHRLYLLNQF